MTFHQQQIAIDIAKKIRQYEEQARLTGNEINSGIYILEIVMKNGAQLLEPIPDDIALIPTVEIANEKKSQRPLSREDVQKAVAWNKRHKVLEIRHHIQLKEIAEERKKLNVYNMSSMNYMIKKLISQGFNLDS